MVGLLGRKGGTIADIETDEGADGELGGGLPRIGELAVDGRTSVDDDGVGVNGVALNATLDAAGVAEDRLKVLAAGVDDIDATCVCVDRTDDAFSDFAVGGGGGGELDLVAGVRESDDDGGAVDAFEGASGETRIDLVGRSGVNHGKRV